MTITPESANPLASAAASILKMEEGPAASGKAGTHAVEAALETEALLIAQNDLSGMEAMLAYQTHMLHRIFTHSLEKYAGTQEQEKTKLYSNIALRAQSYCRLTMNAITQIKKTEERTIKHDNQRTLKLQNELLRKDTPHATTMDGGAASTPSSFDAWMATMEICHRS